jgi:phospholipase A2
MKNCIPIIIACSFFSLHTQANIENVQKEYECTKLFSASITVHNKNNFPIYIATYYKTDWISFGCEKVSENMIIEPQSTITIKRPKWSWTWNRRIISSKNPNDLKTNLTKEEYKCTAHTSIEDLKGDTFYILEKEHLLKCYNYIKWHIVEPVLETVQQITDPIIDQIIKCIAKHDYITTEAQTRIGTNLCTQEETFVQKRKKSSKENLEKLLNMKIPQHATPNIAICFSGGGYRAMMGTLGSLIGAANIGILDSITYMTGLSGSTWLLAPWTTRGIDIHTYKKMLRNYVNLDIIQHTIDPSLLVENILKKTLFEQDLSIIDIYGSFLANRLFHDYDTKRQEMCLSQTQKTISKAKLPLPIYTAIEASDDIYKWFEFTPFEIGSTYLNAFIPTWSFGRKFINGYSENFAPEQSLGFLMGIWGSACSVSLEEIYGHIGSTLNKILPQNIIQPLLTQTFIGDIRISPAHAYNFTKGMQSSPMKYENEFTLVDAGIHINVPVFPLLRPERNIDIIIVCDYSSNAGTTCKEIKKAEYYAHEQGIKFPQISLANLNKKIATVFKGKDTPTIIYLPLIQNKTYHPTFNPTTAEFCDTFNFVYSEKEFDMLTGLTEFNLQKAQSLILNTIKECIKSKM